MNENMQPQQPNMTPDEAAASLAFATKLSEGLMPKAPQTPATAPGQEEPPEMELDIPEENEAPEAYLDAKFDALKEEIRELIKKELSTLKKDVE